MSRGITVSKVRTVKSFFFFLSIKFWLNFLTLIYQVDMVLQNKVFLFFYIIKNKMTLLHVTFV